MGARMHSVDTETRHGAGSYLRSLENRIRERAYDPAFCMTHPPLAPLRRGFFLQPAGPSLGGTTGSAGRWISAGWCIAQPPRRSTHPARETLARSVCQGLLLRKHCVTQYEQGHGRPEPRQTIDVPCMRKQEVVPMATQDSP